MNKFDIVTFGSASWDVFAGLETAETVESDKFLNKGICFNLGSKIDLKSLNFYSGGAGTNTAATFANQGFKTAFVGAVGKDIYGKEILSELKQRKIKSFVKESAEPTNYSIIFSYSDDRTIFAFRGASEDLEEKDIMLNALNSSWFYIATLSGMTAKLTKSIVDFAYKRGIKIALNPGNAQLLLPEEELSDILKKVNILILNQEEASVLTKIPYKDEKSIFKKIDGICPGIAIMTKGAAGAVVSDGKQLYRAAAPNVEVVERTGAGDAFGSGFVSGFIKSKGNVEEAINLAFANGVSCIQHIGAKNGLLKKGDPITKVQIIKNACCPDCECVKK